MRQRVRGKQSPIAGLKTEAPQIEHLLLAHQMAQADRITIARGVDGYVLMQRAGHAVAQHAMTMLAQPNASSGATTATHRDNPVRVLCLCGPGNNGGDGYVAARLLRDNGFSVDVMAPLGPAISADARLAEAGWMETGDGSAIGAVRRGEGEAAVHVDIGRYHLIIDAVFGAGLNRALNGVTLDLMRRVNRAGVPVLAIDVPSGLDSDSGQIVGSQPPGVEEAGREPGEAAHATSTVTFAARKPGHVVLPGRILCGELICADIGIEAATIAAVAGGLYRNTPGLWLAQFPRPSLDAHKYTRGHVLCHSGGPLSTGAIRLSARAALRIGAGLTTIAAGAEACRVHATHLTAIMLHEAENAASFAKLLDDPRFNAVIIGPAGGVGPDLVARIAAAVQRGRALVVDADALTSFAGRPELLQATLTQPRDADAAGSILANAVLTPHDGEFARVFGGDAAVAGANAKWRKAQIASQLTGAIVVLKGADTVIAAPDGRVAINDNAPPWLGTAGSGDVLAGFIGGLLAQGMAAFEAACAAVWIHGAAATAFGPGLIAEDLPDLAPAVLADILSMAAVHANR